MNFDIGDRGLNNSMCRGFWTGKKHDSYTEALNFAATLYSSQGAARRALNENIEYYANIDLAPLEYADPGFTAGDESTGFVGESQVADGTYVIVLLFRVDNALVTWSRTTYPDDSFQQFHDLYQTLGITKHLQDASKERQLSSFIPTLSEMPEGYTLSQEFILGTNTKPIGASITPTPVSTPRQTPTPRPTSTPTQPSVPAVPTPNGKSLQILSLSEKSAGLGDGSFYEYAEVRNNSDDFYSYVSLSATCYDTSGIVVGTGFGNAVNVAPRETFVVTIIMLQVPTCDRIVVSIDSAF